MDELIVRMDGLSIRLIGRGRGIEEGEYKRSILIIK